MDLNVPDAVIGVCFFAGLLALAVFLGGLMQGSAKKRNHRALVPLAGLIGGSVESDQHSAWMHGTYRSSRIMVKISPGRDIAQSSNYTTRVNAFEITLFDVDGAASWEIAHEGLLKKQWRIQAADSALKGLLAGSGLVGRLEKAGNRLKLQYDPRSRSLYLFDDVQPRRAPRPDRLRALLDLAIQAAEINTRVNS